MPAMLFDHMSLSIDQRSPSLSVISGPQSLFSLFKSFFSCLFVTTGEGVGGGRLFDHKGTLTV